jgi:hypothetical protein
MSLTPIEHFDQTAVLKTLNLNVNDPNTQALLLICQRYELDPLMKHVVLIQGRPYITRDGYLAAAHASGQFDGIEVVDEGETETHWWAKASVWRKDMGRPFTYKGRYPKKGGNKDYGPEMAIKCAEVMAMRRAFNVTGAGAADERWDADTDHRITPQVAAGLADRLNALGGPARTAFYDHFGKRRPQDLLADEETDAVIFVNSLEDAARPAELTQPDPEPVDVEVVTDPPAYPDGEEPF